MPSSDRRLFSHEIEERLDQALFASPSHRSTTKLAENLEGLDRSQQERVLRWCAIAAQTQSEIGFLVASLATQAFAQLDAAGFDDWVLSALDAYDQSGTRVAIERMRDLVGFAASRRGDTALSVTQVEERLGRFLQGLAGRSLGIKTGALPWTDSETVFLPEKLFASSTGVDLRKQYKALAVRLWAQTRYGTFDPALVGELEKVGEDCHPRVLRWFALAEAIRLEAAVSRELPGLGVELRQHRAPWPAELAAAADTLSQTAASAATSMAMAIALAANEPPATASDVGVIDLLAALQVRAARIDRDTQILRRALNTLRGTGGHRPESDHPLTVSAKQNGDTVDITLDGEILALPPEAQAAAQSLVQDLGQLPPEILVPAGSGAWMPQDDADNHVSGQEQPGPTDQPRYDEWDYHRHAYRRNWCHLHEHEGAGGDPVFVTETRERHRAFITQIRRRFEMLRGEDRVLGRQPEGDEIDMDALVEALGDRASGNEGSPRLFCRRVRNERSLAAMFMIDMSGSTKGWVNDAEREALIMLCEALEVLGDRYAIYGFSGWTRTRCDIYGIKEFDERYDEQVRSRIAGIEAKDYTRIGVAIRHLSKLLLAQPARHRLLVSLSDGRPDDFGDEYRGRYGIEDTRRALQEAHANGIRSYCVTIDRQGADYLKHMFGPAGFTVLDDVRKLPLRMAEIYRRLAT